MPAAGADDDDDAGLPADPVPARPGTWFVIDFDLAGRGLAGGAGGLARPHLHRGPAAHREIVMPTQSSVPVTQLRPGSRPARGTCRVGVGRCVGTSGQPGNLPASRPGHLPGQRSHASHAALSPRFAAAEGRRCVLSAVLDEAFGESPPWAGPLGHWAGWCQGFPT